MADIGSITYLGEFKPDVYNSSGMYMFMGSKLTLSSTGLKRCQGLLVISLWEPVIHRPPRFGRLKLRYSVDCLKAGRRPRLFCSAQRQISTRIAPYKAWPSRTRCGGRGFCLRIRPGASESSAGPICVLMISFTSSQVSLICHLPRGCNTHSISILVAPSAIIPKGP